MPLLVWEEGEAISSDKKTHVYQLPIVLWHHANNVFYGGTATLLCYAINVGYAPEDAFICYPLEA